MKTILQTLLFVLIFPAFAQSSHLMGGEITWECQATGRFIFTMKIYRDCNGIPGPYSTQTLQSNSPAGNILLQFVDTNDISPVCNPDPGKPHLFCSTADGDDTGSVQEFIFRSAPVSLNGVPPVGGWTFFWEDCCRNLAISNTTCSGYHLRAKMYAWQGKNTFPCFDSSPTFLEQPIIVVCTRYPFAFSGAGVDEDKDSMGYAWDQPLNTGGSACSYAFNYSFSSPLPGPSEDPNNTPTTLNPVTGEVSGTIYTSGSYVICHKVSEYRCGVLIGEIFRDIQIVFKACRSLNPGLGTFNNPPAFDSTWMPQMPIDTIYAGDTLTRYITVQDSDLDPNSQLQLLHMDAFGTHFSSDFTNPGLCLDTPCATLTPDPRITTGTGILNFIFQWITSCNHVQMDTACPSPSVIQFVFRAFDDFCPVPGRTLYTYCVVVLPAHGTPQHPVISESNDTLFCSSIAQGYQWYLNDTAIAGANASFYRPPVAGHYSVEVFGGCGGHSQSYTYTPVGLRDMEFLAQASVFPNPVENSFRLEAFAPFPAPLKVALLDGPGKILETWNLPALQNVRLDVDMRKFPAGCYFLQLNTASVQRTFRIIRMK